MSCAWSCLGWFFEGHAVKMPYRLLGCSIQYIFILKLTDRLFDSIRTSARLEKRTSLLHLFSAFSAATYKSKAASQLCGKIWRFGCDPNRLVTFASYPLIQFVRLCLYYAPIAFNWHSFLSPSLRG